jgi:hypothetical protein
MKMEPVSAFSVPGSNSNCSLNGANDSAKSGMRGNEAKLRRPAELR